MQLLRGVPRVVLLLAVTALVVGAPSANASVDQVRGGQSALFVPFSDVVTLAQKGINISPISPAFLTFNSFQEGPALRFPVSGGTVESDTMVGTVNHAGGMSDTEDRSRDEHGHTRDERDQLEDPQRQHAGGRRARAAAGSDRGPHQRHVEQGPGDRGDPLRGGRADQCRDGIRPEHVLRDGRVRGRLDPRPPEVGHQHACACASFGSDPDARVAGPGIRPLRCARPRPRSSARLRVLRLADSAIHRVDRGDARCERPRDPARPAPWR